MLGFYAFGLEGTGPNKNFESKEGVNKPELIIQYGGASLGYGTWASQWGIGVGTETNDYDGDGQNNFWEYALNGNPTQSTVLAAVPILGSGDTNLHDYDPARVPPQIRQSSRA